MDRGTCWAAVHKESNTTEYAHNICMSACVCVCAHSVLFYFLWPQELQLTRHLLPWNSSGKNTGESLYIYVYIYINIYIYIGFQGNSAGKEPAYNAGDPSLIPGSGSSPGERIGYPIMYSWASLVALMVKNLLAESIPGLGRSPGGGHGNPSQYSCLENPHGQRNLTSYSPWRCKEYLSPWILLGWSLTQLESTFSP